MGKMSQESAHPTSFHVFKKIILLWNVMIVIGFWFLRTRAKKKEESVLISRDEALNRDFLRETGYCQLFDFHGFHTPAELCRPPISALCCRIKGN